MDQLELPAGAGQEPSFNFAKDAALRFLAYRSRSEAEVRRRLARRYSPQIIEEVTASLRDQNYLDDQAFASQWRTDRERHRPRGCRMIRRELIRLGVATEVIDLALSGMDEEDNAYRAGQKMARRLSENNCTEEEFRQRIREHLARRGFAYSLLDGTVRRLWQELAADPLHRDKNPQDDEEYPKQSAEKRPGL